MEATLGRTTWASRLPRRHGRRAQAPRDGWWLAPTCRKHAATSPDWPRPGSAQACARRCVQRAGRLAGWLWVEMGRRDPSRRSPSARGMHINHVGRSWWAGAVRRGGCNLERLRRARPLAQWVGAGGCTAGGVPHRSEHPPHSQRPHNMHVYQARTENPCSMGLEGCYTRAERGTDIWYLRGRDGALLQAAARGSCT